MLTMKELLVRDAKSGRVAWLGVRPQRDVPMDVVDAVQLRPDEGIVGDRYRGRWNGARQVTLIQMEHLPVIAALAQCGEVRPETLRRNVVVEGINLLSLVNSDFAVGGAMLHGTGRCHPCSKMETALGLGGYNAMRGHGGITARVVEPGVVRIGDAVTRGGR